LYIIYLIKLNNKKMDLQNIGRYIFRAHPWHGVNIGKNSPKFVNAYIELVPTDTVKYEVDKITGFLRVDRPQLYSNICPSLYGLIPQTYCGKRVAEYCQEKTGRGDIEGDHDPLDVCVLTEKLVPTGNVLVTCKPIGGFRMIDGGEADDKIIAIMSTDAVYSNVNDISQLPDSVVNRLKHYFLTYKQSPDNPIPKCEITHVYGKEEAYEVIKRAIEDYDEKFPGLRKIVDDFSLD